MPLFQSGLLLLMAAAKAITTRSSALLSTQNSCLAQAASVLEMIHLAAYTVTNQQQEDR